MSQTDDGDMRLDSYETTRYGGRRGGGSYISCIFLFFFFCFFLYRYYIDAIYKAVRDWPIQENDE
jgi:hypothetical protein